MYIIPYWNRSKCKFIIHTRTTIMWSTQTTLINKILISWLFKCLICIYHSNKKLYHIMIMDLCNWYITLLILLHITCWYNILLIYVWQLPYLFELWPRGTIIFLPKNKDKTFQIVPYCDIIRGCATIKFYTHVILLYIKHYLFIINN